MYYGNQNKNSNVTLKQILEHDTKEVSKAKGVLSRLLRVLMFEWGINPKAYNSYMTKWLTNPANGVYKDSNERSTVRGNINKEFARPNISWSVIMKAFRFFAVWRVDLRIICWKADGKDPSYHKFGFTTGVVPPKQVPTEEQIEQIIRAYETSELNRLKKE
jgi:hypothetical protein